MERIRKGTVAWNSRIICILGALLCIYSHSISQNQALSDSLEAVYRDGHFEEKDRFEILKTLSEEHVDNEKSIAFAEDLIARARSLDSTRYVVSGFLQKGNALRLKGDLSQALESYFEAATVASEGKMHRKLGLINVAIADVYSIMGNHDRSVSYYHRAIDILRQENDSVNLASAILNAGDEFFNYGELDSALAYFEESGRIFETLEYEVGLAYNLGNIGLVYAQMGDARNAEYNITQAVDILAKLGDYYPISVYLTYMSDIYRERGEEEAALDFARRSLELAEAHGLKDQISDANLKLSEIHEEAGRMPEAFRYFKEYIEYRDSVSNIDAVQEMANLRADYEVAQKQIEVDLLNEKQKNQRRLVIIVSIGLGLIGLLAIGLFRRNRQIRRSNAIIAEEKNRSDHLLRNILPVETARELKESGRVKAQSFESVTVLFADFKNFSHFAGTLTPEKLVETVDYYFSCFDEIMEKYGMEKIKTIGDAYMAAGGLPFPTDDHAIRMVKAAIEIVGIAENAKDGSGPAEAAWDLRIGLNTGPVVAGVVGTKKFAYDIWGDTVNIAARMESNSEPGKINISENTWRLIRDEFECTYRGEIRVKNRGVMKMYFVDPGS